MGWTLLLIAGLPAGVATWRWPGADALVLATIAATLGLVALAARLFGADPARELRREQASLRRLLARDPDHLLLTDATGRAGPGEAAPQTRLAAWCADPDEAVRLLIDEVRELGAARRHFRRASGSLHLSVHGVATPGLGAEALLLWRFTPSERAVGRGVDALGLPVLTLGPDGQRPQANRALRALLAPAAAVPGADIPELVLDQIAPLLNGQARQVGVDLPDGQVVSAFSAVGQDGQRDVFLLPHRLADDGGLGEHDDIPVALLQLDGEGRIADANRAARHLMGLLPGDDRFLWEVVEGLGRPVADWLQDARAGRALNRPEVLRAIASGAESYVQITLRRPVGGTVADGLLAVVSDATELKSLEARFVQSQKMQAIGQLAGGVAHDFNNLLTAISGHCDLLLMGRDPLDADYNDLVQIHQNANRAAALVRQLLAFSRKQTLQPEVLTLEELLEDVTHLLTRLVGERVGLHLQHDPTLPPIRADRRQLEQVIVNLVVNARDAMPMGGEVRIETEALTLSEDRAIGRVRVPAGAYAVIRVIDSGIGIPPDQIDKIFEPFYTTKRQGEGTGLGLSTAYGIVKQMGGFIFVDSIEGAGTTFTLYFGATQPADPSTPGTQPSAQRQARPRTLAPALQRRGLRLNHTVTGPPEPGEGAGPAEPWFEEPVIPEPDRADGLTAAHQGMPAPGVLAPGMPEAPLNGRNTADPVAASQSAGGIVLLVEDEAPVRAFAARALRMQGFQVLEAQDGEQALEILSDLALAIDVFVTDVIMPGIDGPGWVARALQDRPGTPVVFVSGYIEEALTEALGRTPLSVFLEKPFSLDGLCRAISDQLAQVRSAPD